MHHVHLIWRGGHGAQPLHQLAGICMRRGRFQLDNLRVDFYVATMDAQQSGATSEGSAPRTWRLVACQDDHIAVVARMVGQVMQYAPAGGHAAGLAFYDFPQIPDLSACKADLRARLDALPLAPAGVTALVAEAREAFARNAAVFADLLPT